MKKGNARQATYRKDYIPYPWSVGHVSLKFDLHDTHTVVDASIGLSSADGNSGPVTLDGHELELISIAIDGRTLDDSEYSISGDRLVIGQAPAECTVSTRVHIKPQENSALDGLYASGDFYLTQCEPEGFRKITWFPDRPDVMTCYDVTIEADQARFPVLLSNGNLVDQGEAGAGRHWVRWDDPFPKPSYLFALVAGDLAYIEDHFITGSGRDVTLRVYVEEENLDRCDHAMESLINSMRWDEDRFNLEYDLDIYNIVATNDFNMGAMENKSLNIFNSKYVLARPDTATDVDYQGIEGVIGHEYFHNWTGNRVTCRDWFQLTLKEGLTVFRDEEFSSDMQSHAVKRIQDVRDLRNRQYPEDAGPMSHPIRPDHFVEINNFYTATVYQKGAAVIRLYHTLLGEEGFQEGMRLYFERHDGQAVTCDDFLAAMADANETDLEQFSRWYSQSGTPEVTVTDHWDEESNECTLTLSQHTPDTADESDKRPLVIPFAIGLLDQQGQELPVIMIDESAEESPGKAGTTRILDLVEKQQSFVFSTPCRPVPSLLRNFSAPVKVHYDYSGQDLATLVAHDTDAFARWEAAQSFALQAILNLVSARAEGRPMVLPEHLIEAYGSLLEDRHADPALIAEALMLPAEDYIAEQMEIVDVDGIHAGCDFLRQELATELQDGFRARYDEMNHGAPYSKAPADIGRRSLKNVCLSYLASLPGGCDLAASQLAASDNMTDTLAAMRCLVRYDEEQAAQALVGFENKWSGDALVMDKWFIMQAARPGHDTIVTVRALMDHPEFSLLNPNKVRALIGVFSMLNPTGFHAPGGEGYRFLADQVIALDALNPQIAARIAASYNRWPIYDANRRALMKGELQRIADVDGLSNDVFEIVSNALKLQEPE